MPGNSSFSDYFLEKETKTFSDFIYGNRINIFLILLGLIFLSSGFLIFRNFSKETEIEIVESIVGDETYNDIVIEIAGAVEKPGVYSFTQNSRVEDILIKSGGISANADRDWVEKYINRAAKLIDGQKFYIPRVDEQLQEESASNLSRDPGSV